MADRGQRLRSAGCCNNDLRASALDAVGDTLDFARYKSPQLTHLGFSRWVVPQKFVGQANRAERQADGITDVTPGGDGQLTAAAAQVRHQYRRGIYAQG